MTKFSHGHYTTARAQHEGWRRQVLDARGDRDQAAEPDGPAIRDDEIRESLLSTQIRLQRERGTDATIFLPRAGDGAPPRQ